MKTPDTHIVKTALISVSDKTGIVDFARELANKDVTIYSTGGTAKLLKENSIPVKSVSEITNFPEIMDGRVKTLHPNVHAGMLADLGKESHIAQMKEHNISSIDLLVVNLYPFEQTLAKPESTHEDMIENIDIGGPAMLRAAAKNYKWTATVVNPDCYAKILEEMSDSNTISLELRTKLAAEVYSLTAYYDSVISKYMREYCEKETEQYGLGLKKAQSLRYGENPHQKATLFGANFYNVFEQLHGKELSYNNIIDLSAAAQIIIEFEEPTVALIKHTNPCGVGIADNIVDAYHKAFATDNVSPYGGIFAANRTVDMKFAETVHGIFSEIIIAPDFTEEALELLQQKKNRRLIKVDFDNIRNNINVEYKSVVGGYLMQESDKQLLSEEGYKVVTKRQPTEAEMQGLKFAWKVCKHVKSNAIVYTSNDRTLGIGAGQMSRVDSSRIAVEKAKLMNLDLQGSVLASDAFFPFADGLIEAAKAGVTAIIQPGGSVRDEEVIQAADENNIAMIFTGMRHFKH